MFINFGYCYPLLKVSVLEVNKEADLLNLCKLLILENGTSEKCQRRKQKAPQRFSWQRWLNLTLDQSMQPRFVEKDQKGLENPLLISAVIYSAYFFNT